MKKDSATKIMFLIFGIFAVVGILLLFIGICFGVNSRNYAQNAEQITGTITHIGEYQDQDGDYHHKVSVDFSYHGKEYHNVELSEYESSMYEGKEIILLFDPEGSGKVRTKSMIYFPTILLCSMGAVFMLIGVIPILILLHKERRNKKLRESGRRLEAKVESIELNYNMSINGRHPYIVICSYQDIYSGMLYRFKSNSLMTNPEPVLKAGDSIDVYVQENDYSKYYVAAEERITGRIMDYS